MKYSLHARQPLAVLRKGDEIMVEYKDVDKIYDFIYEFENEPKDYVVRINLLDGPIDWPKLEGLDRASNFRLTCAIDDMVDLVPELKEEGLTKWYWSYPITTYYELEAIMAFEPTQLLLGAPLYFDLPEVKKRGVPIRLVANRCYEGLLPHETGVCGTYVRPEDVDIYDEYIDTLEFYISGPMDAALKKEHVLIDTYHQKNWPGNLNLLLTDLGENVDNRAIPEQFGEARIQCRQGCMRNSRCKLCKTLIKFAQTVDKTKPTN